MNMDNNNDGSQGYYGTDDYESGGYLPQLGLPQLGLPQPGQTQTGQYQSGLPQTGFPQYGLQNSEPQHQVQYTILDYIGEEFKDTPASKYDSPKEMAKALNDALSLLGSKKIDIQNLNPDQRELLKNEFREHILRIPEDVAEYELESDRYFGDDETREEHLQNIAMAAKELGIPPEEGQKLAEYTDGIANGVEQGLEDMATQLHEEYIEDSTSYFGSNLDDILESAEKVTKEKIPYIVGGTAHEFLDWAERHGIAGHRFFLSMLKEISTYYYQNDAPGVPSVAYGGGSPQQVGASFYKTPEAMKILADRHHPKYQEYVAGLMRSYGLK
jgi:hypothetical protein